MLKVGAIKPRIYNQYSCNNVQNYAVFRLYIMLLVYTLTLTLTLTLSLC